MGNPVIQTSFHAGEWAPNLNARVDLAKYKAGAALLRNFFVDYRGGASTRMGTKYILQAFDSTKKVRLIPFQASFSTGYILEFGELYIRFYSNGAPILETAIAITGATKANPCVITVANSWSVGDIIYVTGVSGMTQLNGHYFKLSARDATTATLADLNGVAINSSAYSTYTSGGTAARVYKITSPYAAADLALLKFAQNVTTLILTHPNYTPRQLVISSPASWALTEISFGSTAATPTGQSVATTLSAGLVNYAYQVTSVDSNGQESGPSAFATSASKQDLRSTAGTNTISWSAATGAASYNVYKAELSYAGAVPSGSDFGFIGNVTGLSLVDSNITPDYTVGPPIPQNPFFGAGVASVTVTAAGSYASNLPTVSFSAPGGSGVTATGNALVTAIGVTLGGGGSGNNVGDRIGTAGGVQLRVTATGGAGEILSFSVLDFGQQLASVTNGAVTGTNISTPSGDAGFYFITYGVTSVSVSNPGTAYGSPPTVTFTPSSATATTTLGAGSLGNPSVPGFFQQRMILAAPPAGVQTFFMSKPGSPYNFDISAPIQANDSIKASISSGQLNDIKALISWSAGELMLTSRAIWQVTGGSAGSVVTPIDITANTNSYIGINDVPPIIANADILYVQSKGSVVRNATYNFYTNIFTGTDITVLSSHLFFGYQILEWAWAEEPFKVAWAVRSDGQLLALTFLKEQELIAWAHSDTEGTFQSVATITESTSNGYVDAVYFVVTREVNGNTVQYIERMADRYFTGITDPWCVDAGLQYSGTATTSFTGGEHLAGMTVTGLADGAVIPSFTMPTNGNFTITTAASIVTVGLGFTPQLQTLQIDTGEPTIQSEQKKIPTVTVRVDDTLGLWIGSDSDHLVAMKDLVIGNVGSLSNEVVTGLVSGDAMTTLDPKWSEQGQFFISQPNPYPATILGVIPELTTEGKPKK